MARIRTIKPDFWTDSLMVQLDALTRLLYIGVWTASDDHGAVMDEPERLAMEIMPREDPDEIAARVDLLIATGRLSRMIDDEGGSYLQIEKWKDHQRVDKPSKSRLLREDSRKLAIPAESRRKVAIKYGCEPGEVKEASCYFCGNPGTIHWPRLSSGKPGSWVAFSGLELDHFHPESEGGDASEPNLVLSCRGCNRARRDRSVFDFVTARLSVPIGNKSQASSEFDNNLRESSRDFLVGKERKGKERIKERKEAALPTEETPAPQPKADPPPPPPEPENSKPAPDAAQNRDTQIAVLLRRNGADSRTHANSKGIADLAKMAATDVQILSALETGKLRRKESGSLQPVTAAYLVPIVRELQNPPPEKPAPEQDKWWTSNAGIDRKARELGLFARGNEDYASFKDRIFDAIKSGKAGTGATA